MVFPIKLPQKSHRITFQIWDKDVVSVDDFISEATLDFTMEALQAFETEKSVKVIYSLGVCLILSIIGPS